MLKMIKNILLILYFLSLLQNPVIADHDSESENENDTTWNEYENCSKDCTSSFYSTYKSSDVTEQRSIENAYQSYLQCFQSQNDCQKMYEIEQDDMVGEIQDQYVENYKKCFESCKSKITNEVIFDYLVCDQNCFGNETDYKYSTNVPYYYYIIISIISVGIILIICCIYRKYKRSSQEARNRQQRIINMNQQNQQNQNQNQYNQDQQVQKSDKQNQEQIEINEVQIADDQNQYYQPQQQNDLYGYPLQGASQVQQPYLQQQQQQNAGQYNINFPQNQFQGNQPFGYGNQQNLINVKDINDQINQQGMQQVPSSENEKQKNQNKKNIDKNNGDNDKNNDMINLSESDI